MRSRQVVVLAIAAAILSGCASMNADECLMAVWQVIGYEDGTRGKSSSSISTYRKSCAEHGVAPDFESYTAGYQRGLASYCTPNTAFTIGKSGRNRPGVCSDKQYSDFAPAFAEGRIVYGQISNLSQQISATGEELNELDEQIEFLLAAKYEVGADGTVPTDTQTETADKLIRRLELDHQDLQLQQDQLEAELQSLRLMTQN